MVVEHDTIEEYVEILSTFDSSDQLKIIAELTKRLANKATEEPCIQEENEVDKVKPSWRLDPDWNSEVELAKVRKAHREKYGEVGDSWKELAGAWKDSTPDNLVELIRSDRGPEKEPPNFDD